MNLALVSSLATFSSATLLAAARRGVALGLASMVVFAGVGCAGASGAEEDDNTAETTEDLSAKPSDAVVKADLTKAAAGFTFTSESDFPFTFVTADVKPGTRVTQASVKAAFASVVDASSSADQPMASLQSETVTFAKWKQRTSACDKADDECNRIHTLNAVIAKDLVNVNVFRFGRSGANNLVSGVAVSYFVVGKTRSGKFAGVWTISVET